MTQTVDQFARRLRTVAGKIDYYAAPILTGFGEVVAGRVEDEAPKRTRARTGGRMVQTAPGRLELQGGHLVGSDPTQASGASADFLTGAFDDISGELAASVAKTALAILTDNVSIRRRP